MRDSFSLVTFCSRTLWGMFRFIQVLQSSDFGQPSPRLTGWWTSVVSRPPVGPEAALYLQGTLSSSVVALGAFSLQKGLWSGLALWVSASLMYKLPDTHLFPQGGHGRKDACFFFRGLNRWLRSLQSCSHGFVKPYQTPKHCTALYDIKEGFSCSAKSSQQQSF